MEKQLRTKCCLACDTFWDDLHVCRKCHAPNPTMIEVEHSDCSDPETSSDYDRTTMKERMIKSTTKQEETMPWTAGETMTLTGLDFDGKIVEVKIGDFAGFEDDDTEQGGEVIQIKTRGSSIILTLENGSGFEGRHLEGETQTNIHLRDCWIY